MHLCLWNTNRFCKTLVGALIRGLYSTQINWHPLSLSLILLVTWVQGWGFLGTWFVFIPLGVHSLWRILCLLGLGSFHLVPFSPPWLGALFYWWLASFLELDHCKKKHMTYLPTSQLNVWDSKCPHRWMSILVGQTKLAGRNWKGWEFVCAPHEHTSALQHTHFRNTHPFATAATQMATGMTGRAAAAAAATYTTTELHQTEACMNGTQHSAPLRFRLCLSSNFLGTTTRVPNFFLHFFLPWNFSLS